MQKNIQDLVSELKDLKKGLHIHSTQWVGIPVTEIIIDTAIAALQNKGDAIDSAKAMLSQTLLDGRDAIEKYANHHPCRGHSHCRARQTCRL